jgi:hypothetical protein
MSDGFQAYFGVYCGKGPKTGRFGASFYNVTVHISLRDNLARQISTE